MDSTWHAYEDALLTTMGCSSGSFRGGDTTIYRLLLQPTFHRTCCIAISIEESAAEAQIVILEADSHDLFMAAVKHDPRLSEASFLALRACSGDVTDLSLIQIDRFRGLLDDADLDTLPDVDFGGRDGISIRLDRLASERNLVVRMSSPTRRESPTHHHFVREVLVLAQEVFPAFNDYLARVSSYLGS